MSQKKSEENKGKKRHKDAILWVSYIQTEMNKICKTPKPQAYIAPSWTRTEIPATTRTMSGSSNNFTPTPGNWHPGEGYRGHGPFNRLPPILPRPPFGVAPNASGGLLETWIPIEERRTMARPLGFASFPPTSFLVLDEVARGFNPRPRQSIPESPPRFIEQWRNMQVPAASREEESMLTQDEQKQALNKLKKKEYNPTPTSKKIAKRMNLYYRHSPNAGNSFLEKEKDKDEDEDGKRCAVCLDDFEPREVVMLTPCSHMFHEDCIVPWVKSHGQCPVCRFAICERMKQRAVPLNNNNAGAPAGDLFDGDIMSIIRAMDEVFEWGRRFH